MTNKNESATKRASRPTYNVTLRVLDREDGDNDPAGIRRLRAFLKVAARSWGLQCTSIGPGPGNIPPFGGRSATDGMTPDDPLFEHPRAKPAGEPPDQVGQRKSDTNSRRRLKQESQMDYTPIDNVKPPKDLAANVTGDRYPKEMAASGGF